MDHDTFIMIAIFLIDLIIGYWFIAKSKLAYVYKASLLLAPTFMLTVFVIYVYDPLKTVAIVITLAVCIGLLFYGIKRRVWIQIIKSKNGDTLLPFKRVLC